MVLTHRDVRATVKSIDGAVQRLRSAQGSADTPMETLKTIRRELEEEVANAKAMVQLAKGSGVDVVKLNEKVVTARSLLSGGNKGLVS